MSTRRFVELDRVGGRAAFLAFVLAFLGSAFAAGAHWIAVPHRVCDVHGTIEHGTADATDVARSAPASPQIEGPIVRPADDAHEDCSVGAGARTEAILPTAAHSPGLLLPEPIGAVVVRSEATPSVPLLALAPSRSPPA